MQTAFASIHLAPPRAPCRLIAWPRRGSRYPSRYRSRYCGWTCLGWMALASLAQAAEGPVTPVSANAWEDSALTQRVQAMALQGATAGTPPGSQAAMRVEVEVGRLDPRLTLAPCRKVEPYLPPGLPVSGHTRVGLRCVDGAKPWNVSLPITVHVWTLSLVSTTALPAGTVLESAHLTEAEVDLAAAPGAAIGQMSQALGRTLSHTVAAGAALRLPDLKPRQWFAAGETVKLVATGLGWRVVSEGQAVTAGLEGLPVRVRTESGHILQGRPVADREVEVAL